MKEEVVFIQPIVKQLLIVRKIVPEINKNYVSDSFPVEEEEYEEE